MYEYIYDSENAINLWIKSYNECEFNEKPIGIQPWTFGDDDWLTHTRNWSTV